MTKADHPQFKKKVIIGLLAVSCLIAGFILAYTSSADAPHLRSLAEVDTLIYDELTQFNIERSQVDRTKITVDSNFVRKMYRVRVSPLLSKTHLHTSLHQRLYPLDVQSPAKVHFPGEEMNIQLVYDETVFRTIKLQNDTSLAMEHHPAHVLVYFDSPPNETMQNKLVRFGEPIPMIIRMKPGKMEQMEPYLRSASEAYNWIAFWTENRRPGSLNDIETGQQYLNSREKLIKQLYQVDSDAHLLFIRDQMPYSLEQIQPALQENDAQIYTIGKPLILNAGSSNANYHQVIDEFRERSLNNEEPVLMVFADEALLDKLHDTLLSLKKQGLYISLPDLKRF